MGPGARLETSVLFNNAGFAVAGDVRDIALRDWRHIVDVNLMGPIAVLEYLVPPMIEAGRGGHVVNVSSAAGSYIRLRADW